MQLIPEAWYRGWCTWDVRHKNLLYSPHLWQTSTYNHPIPIQHQFWSPWSQLGWLWRSLPQPLVTARSERVVAVYRRCIWLAPDFVGDHAPSIWRMLTYSGQSSRNYWSGVIFRPLQIFMRSWASFGQNNKIPSMVTSCFDPINHVEPDVYMPDTLMHSCRGYVGRGGMAAVTAAFIYHFGIGCCHHDFLLVCLVYF